MSKKWEKVLYKKQKFPDNYVDPSFLSDLRKNVNLRYYTWWEAFTGVSFVAHEVSCTVLFVTCFIFMKENFVSSNTVLVFIAILTFSSFILMQFISSNPWSLNKNEFFEYLKSGVIFLLFGYIFSPVLKNLTQTISTDTIYAMVSLMMMAHVMFQDYGADAAIVSSTLSLNSALFAAVCLASRLPSVMHTFCLMLLAVDIFVLLPLIRKRFKNCDYGILLLSVVFITIVLIILFYISHLFAVLFAVLCIFINIIFPALFIYCQKYKQNIFGPWDEAIVKS